MLTVSLPRGDAALRGRLLLKTLMTKFCLVSLCFNDIHLDFEYTSWLTSGISKRKTRPARTSLWTSSRVTLSSLSTPLLPVASVHLCSLLCCLWALFTGHVPDFLSGFACAALPHPQLPSSRVWRSSTRTSALKAFRWLAFHGTVVCYCFALAEHRLSSRDCSNQFGSQDKGS